MMALRSFLHNVASLVGLWHGTLWVPSHHYYEKGTAVPDLSQTIRHTSSLSTRALHTTTQVQLQLAQQCCLARASLTERQPSEN